MIVAPAWVLRPPGAQAATGAVGHAETTAGSCKRQSYRARQGSLAVVIGRWVLRPPQAPPLIDRPALTVFNVCPSAAFQVMMGLSLASACPGEISGET